ncbi:hypothetical protein A5768_26370 [Mycolicibacterium fortuitum]|uniref:ribonuclease H-like domain-containing protein n=1 Tax=Mycolicibacterium fortuitum TaxID=1766 RepID=UPI0007E999FB|nr:ribonuclease H-like domain-containing protein [Mycolicibacterium fortuitum]OBG21629.1 hypothetical protein A5768_26370 [Mycolicibacterium fortuitum]
MTATGAGDEPILLGGYAAKQCPVRTQLDFGPAPLKWDPAPEDQARLDAGIKFEAEVFAELVGLHPGAVVIDPGLTRDEAISMTLRAMKTGSPLVLGGWLPDDTCGGRKGRPDILVRVDGGYLPADVKHHRSVEAKKTTTAQISELASPASWREVKGWTSATTYRFSDGMQLAHYTRMLQACGYHPGPDRMRGAVLGTSRLPGAGGESLVLVWHNLDEPLAFTFSRRRGKARRSLMERYDHEHGFRIAVATAARQEAAGTAAMVTPVRQPECRSCPYARVCDAEMGATDASNAMTVGTLDIREWLTLRRMGITTLGQLASIDVDDPAFLSRYHPEVAYRGRDYARARLAEASQRAAMLCSGVHIAHVGDGPVSVPSAEIEIDLDIEWGADGRVYLWGARVRNGQDESSAMFVPFAEWSRLDDSAERDLAERFAAWLRELRDQSGRSVRVFHWSAAEPSRLKKILGEAAGDLLDPATGVFTDLESVFKGQFFSVHGSSIKTVAPYFGFTWRASDAGGSMSQTRLDAVHDHGADAEGARAWLLSYNADDTTAMAVIRDGMRNWTPARGAAPRRADPA